MKIVDRLIIPIIILVVLAFVGVSSFRENITPVIQQELELAEQAERGYAYGNAIITLDEDYQYRYISSNGLPEHETGMFPNSGNPNSISEQDHQYRVTLTPEKTNSATPVQLSGVALNGIPLEPGTAETWNGDRNWSIEAFNAEGIGTLGIDWSNAHVQPDGTYHYHAVPEGLLETAQTDQSGDLIQLAWAADGFPMYYSLSNAYQSSWQLKSGARNGGPGGTYDGTYTQDFEYIAGSGDLDQCNGTTIGGSYAYIITNSFPYITRCVFGTPDDSFNKGPGAGIPPQQQGGQTQAGPGNTPPTGAITACSGKSENAACTFSTPNGTLSGVCRTTPDNSFACVPN